MAKIVIYSLPKCSHCQQAKQWLEQKGIVYEDKDVGEDQNAREEMIAKSGQMSTPVLIVNGKVIKGFRPNEIEEALKSN